MSVVALVRPARGGDQLLDDARDTLARHVKVDGAALTACALFIAHTHAFEAAHYTPYMYVHSPVPECGKSTLLKVIEALSNDAHRLVSVTAATLFRLADQSSTLLLDEIDATFTGEAREALRSILNAGFERGYKVFRCEGNELVKYEPFSPKVLAGIQNFQMPETVLSRSIEIVMHRASPGTIEPVSPAAMMSLRPLAEELSTWAQDRLGTLSVTPSLPTELGSRARDIWAPLVAIADNAGGHWPESARQAAVALSGHRQSDDMMIRLLADCRTVWDRHGEPRMKSATLVNRLIELPDAGWDEANNDGGHITAKWLANKLKPFNIRPTRWGAGVATQRGYLRADFEMAWSRYLPTS